MPIVSLLNAEAFYAIMGVLPSNKLSDILEQGIMDIYIAHAENHISKHLQTGTISDISRRQVELDVLQVLDKNNFPIEMKLSWYHAVRTRFITILKCHLPPNTARSRKERNVPFIQDVPMWIRLLTIHRSSPPHFSNRFGVEHLCAAKFQPPI